MDNIITFICDLCHTNPNVVKFTLISAAIIIIVGGIFIWIMVYSLNKSLGEIEGAISGSIKSKFFRLDVDHKKHNSKPKVK